MELNIQAVHFELTDETREFVNHRLDKLDFVHDLIVHTEFVFTKERHEYALEARVHFRWRAFDIVKLRSHDLHEGLNRLFDKLNQKIMKEKNKMQEH